MKRVSILGCGWVGVALKEVLSKNYDVACLSRDMEYNSKNHLYDCEVLVIGIPPRENYLEVLSHTLGHIKSSTQVIHLSSISFYSGKPLVVEGEALVSKHHESSVILRLGGLMGYDRIAGKYTAGKTLESNTTTNYIHRDDVVGIVEAVIQKNIVSGIFDVVAPKQSNKEKVFLINAARFGFEKTTFLLNGQSGRTFSLHKIYELLGYHFVKEDVLTFWD